MGVVAFNSYLNIAEHVTIFTATEDGAKDGSTSDVHLCFFHISPSVEESAIIAHACAEEVTGDRVISNGQRVARHAQGAPRHIDSTFAKDIGNFIASINGGEDVSTRDVDPSVANHTSCRTSPNTSLDGIIARSAAEHIAEEAVAVGTLQSATGRGIRIIGKNVVYIIVAVAITEWPRVTLVEGCCVGWCEPTLLDSQYGGIPLLFGIYFIPKVVAFISSADLAAHNLNIGTTQHQAVLTAAINGSCDECIATDFQIGSVDHSKQVGLGIIDGIDLTSATAENPTTVVVVRIMTDKRHQRAFLTYTSAADNHLCQASIL